jgi:hypothetical protein
VGPWHLDNTVVYHQTSSCAQLTYEFKTTLCTKGVHGLGAASHLLAIIPAIASKTSSGGPTGTQSFSSPKTFGSRNAYVHVKASGPTTLQELLPGRALGDPPPWSQPFRLCFAFHIPFSRPQDLLRRVRCVGALGGPGLVFATMVSIIAGCEAGISPLSALRHHMCTNVQINLCKLPTD